MTNQELRIIPLGGLGEVGKNMMVLEVGDDILIIDAGIMFPENDMLGIDLVIPDFRYLMDKLSRVRAIIVTHGHEDHIGALPYVLKHLQVPIYATRLTMGLIEARLRSRDRQRAMLHVVNGGDRIVAGDFDVEFFRVNHSVPDGVGLAIRTPAGLIVHSGDFKLDYTPVIDPPADLARLAGFGAEGVLALLSDSTNAETAGFTGSERSVQPAFDEIFDHAPGRVIVAAFASHLPRIQQVIWVAARHGRRLAIAGHSIEENIRIAHDLGYLELPPNLLIPMSQMRGFAPQQIAILATGTQGEPTAALGRMAKGNHRQIHIQPGDTVVLSAHPIPGNEEEFNDVINRLFQRGADVVYDKIAPVHVSGHASQEEQKLLLKLIQPRYFVPIHGELRHLHRHARTAQEMGWPAENVFVVENGYVLHFDEQGGRVGERVPGGYVFVDGSGVGDIGPEVLREREMLAEDGFVVIGLKVNRGKSQLVGDAEVISHGFIHMPDAAELVVEINAAVAGLLERLAHYPGRQMLADQLRDNVRHLIYDRTRRRPIVVPIVTELD